MWEFLSKLMMAVLPGLIASAGGAAVSSAMAPKPQTMGGGGPAPAWGGGGPPGLSPGLVGAGMTTPGAMGLSSTPFGSGGPVAANNLNPGEQPPTGTGGGFRTLPPGQRQPAYQTL
mgnify:CR=1 FL=1